MRVDYKTRSLPYTHVRTNPGPDPAEDEEALLDFRRAPDRRARKRPRTGQEGVKKDRWNAENERSDDHRPAAEAVGQGPAADRSDCAGEHQRRRQRAVETGTVAHLSVPGRGEPAGRRSGRSGNTASLGAVHGRTLCCSPPHLAPA